MKLESLSKDLFLQVELSEAAMVLGGMTAPGDGGFHNSYTFFNDGTYVSDDKDQDTAQST